MNFAYYEPAFITLYSLFLIISYGVVLVILLEQLLMSKSLLAYLFLIASFAVIIVGIAYETGAGYFADEAESLARAPSYIFSFDFITICLFSYIFLILSYLSALNKLRKK